MRGKRKKAIMQAYIDVVEDRDKKGRVIIKSERVKTLLTKKNAYQFSDDYLGGGITVIKIK